MKTVVRFVKLALLALLVVVLAGGAGAALGDALFTAVPERQFLRAFGAIVVAAFLAAVACIVMVVMFGQGEKRRKRVAK